MFKQKILNTQKFFVRSRSDSKLFAQPDYPAFLELYRRYFMKVSMRRNKAVLRHTTSLLDLGCRDGKTNHELFSNYVCRKDKGKFINIKKTLGIDLKPNLIEKALKRVREYPNMQYKVENVHEITYNQEFDLVVSFFAFDSFKDKKKVFENIGRAVKPGGNAFVVFHVFHKDPVWVSAQKLAKNEKWNGILGDKTVPIFEERDEIKEYAKASGMIIEKCEDTKLRFPFLTDDSFINSFIKEHHPFIKHLTKEQNEEFSWEILKDMNCERTIEDGTARIWYTPYNYYVFLRKKAIFKK